MEEIIEQVYYEIRMSGFDRQLIGGIVVTGGGSQLKHLPQLFEYITGLDARIGYPNEHLAPNKEWDGLTSPIYSTGIGLVLQGFNKIENNKRIGFGDIEEDKIEKESGFVKRILSLGRQIFDTEEE